MLPSISGATTLSSVLHITKDRDVKLSRVRILMQCVAVGVLSIDTYVQDRLHIIEKIYYKMRKNAIYWWSFPQHNCHAHV